VDSKIQTQRTNALIPMTDEQIFKHLKDRNCSPDPDQLLTDRQVADLLGIARSSVWKFVKEATLPKPIRFGKRCSRWKRSSVLNAITGGDAA
jgi:predicted DNA-binding transcriptional regulator AlpA